MTTAVHSRQSAGLAGPVLLIAATVLWFAIFGILWAPYYLEGAEGQLYLFPLAFLADGIVFVLAALAIVLSTVALVQNKVKLRRFVIVLVGGAVLIVLGPVALYFGNVFNPAIGLGS